MPIYWKWYTLVLVIFDWIVVLVGIIGNILILVSLIRYKTIQNPITKLLFINLTISDLGVLVVRHSVQVVQLYMEGRWILGELACKIIPPVSRTFLTVSIMTLVAISHHRYSCIVGLLRTTPSMRRTVVSVIIFWVSVFALYAVLDIPFRQVDPKMQRCVDTLSPIKYVIFVITEKAFYVMCFVCIFYMFSKMKKVLKGSVKLQENSNIKRQFSASVQTLKILKPTVLVLLITLCPAWLLHMVAVVNHKVSPQPAQRYLMYHIVGTLMVFNSAANPFIYVIMSRSFKHSFRQMLRSFSSVFKPGQQDTESDAVAIRENDQLM